MNIRDFQVTDMPYLYEICLLTGDSGADATSQFSDPYILGQYYAAPYAVRDPKAVLILEGECKGATRPVGYILGTPDTVAYNEWFDARWRPYATALYGAIPDGCSEFETTIRRLFTKTDAGAQESGPPMAEYPGHIHIDILPEAQGSGWGRRLMDAMSQRLRDLGCPGFHLGVGKKNPGGVAFYRRYGMQELGAPAWGYYFGKRLTAVP